ncbi:PREDICTED: uncharacterized protein LOC106806550 [Priapulus caudatus]|uniref:Uncharacterized protein LOC106806550 n=1 Tax=Priapulus caudatus TaxID=37621 RepID=A0ABM1DVP5_PRICU|nr:PREDICTED: uncharacterized protein LOC106806550 [Priapulus caudatus]
MQDQRIAEVLGMGLIGGSTESASAALYLLQSAISPVQSLAEQLSRMEAKRKTDANDVGKGTLPALGSGDLTQKFEKLAVTGNPENGSIEYVASLMARIAPVRD